VVAKDERERLFGELAAAVEPFVSLKVLGNVKRSVASVTSGWVVVAGGAEISFGA
jgi:hypothetical protein